MNIALIGYGKMGKAIEKIAVAQKLLISSRLSDKSRLPSLLDHKPDLAIEFTQPGSAYENIRFCLENDIPVISGTTGWLDKYEELATLCHKHKGTMLHSSNFSIGVNLFFELNEWLAKKTDNLDYSVSITETHHTEKKDSPSGTAVRLAEGIIAHHAQVDGWINEQSTDHKKTGIISERKANVPGTHTVTYTSEMESIALTHTAHDRQVFAEGVVKVAQWIHGKKGVFTISDFING